MRIATCKLPPGGTIVVQAKGSATRVFSYGDSIDLEAVIVPTDSDGDTWGEALGHHVEDHFTLDAALPVETSPHLEGQALANAAELQRHEE